MSDTAGQGRTLKRQEVWKGSVGSFGIEQVVLPNGNQATLAVLKHPGAAAVVPFLDAERILLLRQYRHAVGGMIWEAPAGKLEPGESPEACMERELLEETGFRAARLELLGKILTTPGFSDEVIYLYRASGLARGERRLDAHEVIDVHEMALAEALSMVDRGEIIDAKTVAALFHVARRAT